MPDTDTTTPPDGALPLTHWGLIRAHGPDAAAFLQGQLTGDVSSLAANAARLAGFCSAKGRLQASFVVWKAGADEFLLACAADVAAAVAKRLSMFVLRAKCRITDASGERALQGVAGASALALAGGLAPWTHRDTEGGSIVRLPDVDGIARCLVVADRPLAIAVPALDAAAWRSLELRSGIAQIEAATVDRFVPQMVNFELVGGVDFGKGCYPGQEVVARSQYRGTIKRRAFLFESPLPLQAGQEVFHADDPDQPAGMVVNAAANLALVEVKLAALDPPGALHAVSADGPALTRRPLPYAVPLEQTA